MKVGHAVNPVRHASKYHYTLNECAISSVRALAALARINASTSAERGTMEHLYVLGALYKL